MANLNEHYRDLKDSYLFSEIAKRVDMFAKTHPEKKIIRMGIGDVTLPLAPAVIEAMHTAADEMGKAESFRGYGPEQGYAFLREAIRDYYAGNGVALQSDEIFVSDGAKSDVGNITDLFAVDNTVLVPDPVYPVYVDTNIMDGRRIIYMDANADNGFLPMPDRSVHADLIYLCSPNNPTGAVYSKARLEEWVAYARENNAVILFDAAYEAFIGNTELPHSIYAVPGAEKCAIEFCSLSKTAGFTGTRCAYTVVPHALEQRAGDGTLLSLNRMWNRRQTTKFNGVSYIVQRAAAAVFSEKGIRQAREAIAYYKGNAAVIAKTFDSLGIRYFGGVHSPYIWMECPNGMKSWDFFDLLLEKAAVVGTPGAGFGSNGEGFFRLTGFGSREQTEEAMKRIQALLG